MQTKLLIAASAGALALAGVGAEWSAREEKPAFLDPAFLARSVCGDDGAAQARRALFIRTARAIAADQPIALAPAEPARIGAIAYKITTSNPAAQAYFDLGLAHMWNFNHGAAVAAFTKAQETDPDCAMCYWAESFAHGPNINAAMADEAVAPAFAAARKAMALRDKAGEAEKALIDAIAARYAAEPVADRSALDAAFADAMDKAAASFPDDDLVVAVAAEANMDTQPWDYWEADGRTPKGRAGRTLSLLEAILARNPDHAAAIHLYIHLVEATDDPYRAVKFADRLAGLSPGLGHLIHMPSHTYFRIGRYKQSLDLNIDAVRADEAFLAANEASMMYEYGYFVHNVHFVMASAQMAGDGPTALAMAEKLDAKIPVDMVRDFAFAQPIRIAPYFAKVQYAAPDAILALDDPGADVPLLQGAWRYARGEAFARTGDAASARAEAEAIAAILADADLGPLEDANVPASKILDVARLTVIARAAAAEGDLGTAVEAMEEAVAVQESLPYTEPAYWYYPAKQTLAAMVLRQGDAERAEQLFHEALVEIPNNGWALSGLAEAYRAQGQKNAAKYAQSLFKDAWMGGKTGPGLERL